ncbi:MAG: SDR family NAD(P)-dependent oxidoreductase [Candidatus Poriferisodalaceae bacterium]
MSTYQDLENKVVLVTGAGSGIGQAMAVRFAEQGALVAVNDVDSASASSTVERIVGSGGSALATPADVSNSVDVNEMFDAIESAIGEVQILVNNAGLVGPMLHFFEADEAWWRKIIDVNLTGHFLCAHRAARPMARAGSGVIINMSSGGATRAHRSFTAYDATKGGIEAFTRALALDLGPYGIRVNALMPGSIDTSGLDLDQRSLRGENIPMGRIGEPDDMTGPALFLASEESGYVTGDVIKVDGGMLAQQRSATVDIMPPSDFPDVGDL